MITMATYLQMFLGIPYKWGGDNPISGFDCSGLVSEGLRAFGLIRHNERLTAQQIFDRMSSMNKITTAHIDDVGDGDLLFFGRNGQINHVGVAIDQALMIEAGGGGSETNTTPEALATDAFVRVRPITMRKDFYRAILL